MAALLHQIEACGPDDPVTLWTIQHTDAVAQLNNGVPLRGNPTHAFPTDESRKLGKCRAYAWMVNQMKARIKIDVPDLPIWATLLQPACLPPPSVLLRIAVPRKRVLFSFYLPWEQILGVFSDIEKSGGKWPPLWSIPPYLTATEKDESERERQACRIPPEPDCRASWERIFDLKLGHESGFLWGAHPPFIQAVLAEVCKDDIVLDPST